MSDTNPSMTQEEIDAIRAEAKKVMTAEGMTATAVSKESGVVYGTLSSWLGGTYAGRNDRIAGEVQKWLRSRVIRAQTQAMAPVAPRYIATPTAEAFEQIFRHAQHMPDFAVVVGAPGVGKTSAACHYTRNTPNVFKVTAHPMLQSPRALMDELARALSVYGGGGQHRVQRALVGKLRGSGALLMVDEAQHLSPAALDQLRSLHDEAEIGVVLIGNPAVYGRLEGQGRQKEFAQLFSRVGMRLAKPKPVKADIDALLDAWGMEDAETRALLHAIARKPGALRGMTKTLKLAHMEAAFDRQKVGAAHIRSAFQRLSATDMAQEAA